MASAKLRRRTMRFFVAKIETSDLAYLGSLLEAGTIRSVIDRTYSLHETPAALAYLGEGHAQGRSSSRCEVAAPQASCPDGRVSDLIPAIASATCRCPTVS
jgi:hypothetical protein